MDSQASNVRKVGLITGITGQVSLIYPLTRLEMTKLDLEFIEMTFLIDCRMDLTWQSFCWPKATKFTEY